jgi:hypothetical protein
MLNGYSRTEDATWSGFLWFAYWVCALFVTVSVLAALFVGSCLFWFYLGRALLRAFA